MTISMKQALNILNEKKGDINLNDLGFILTVIRDNASDDEVYKVLNSILKEQLR
jgi:Ca2+-binding EF-hand superfamily protein